MLAALRDVVVPLIGMGLTFLLGWLTMQRSERKRTIDVEEASKAIPGVIGNRYAESRSCELLADAIGLQTTAIMDLKEWMVQTEGDMSRRRTLPRLLEDLTCIQEHLGTIARVLRENRHDANTEKTIRQAEERFGRSGSERTRP